MYKQRIRRDITNRMNPGIIPDVSSMVSTPRDSEEFFQFEPAVVLDVILDDVDPLKNRKDIHPELENSTISQNSTPPQMDGRPHDNEIDLSLLGHIRARLLYSEKGASALATKWITPLNSTFTEIPLINEIVLVVSIRGKLYYTNRVFHESRLNYSGDFSAEFFAGDGLGRPLEPSSYYSNTREEYDGPLINITYSEKDSPRNYGVGGKYFSFNDKIRRLRRFEGDLIIESRFGQSIRFGAYDETVKNFVGDAKYTDYVSKGEVSVIDGKTKINTGKGNPFILIRNRQQTNPEVYTNHFYSTIQEDINLDGSSIQLTSGLTESKLQLFSNQKSSHFKKRIFSNTASEEQPAFSPAGSTNWELPALTGDQITIFSDRIIIGSRSKETLIFSKSRLGIKSDSEVSIDSHQQIVLTTNEKTVLNSPFIYLGQYDETKEPVVLGETMIEWLYELGQWLKNHTHYYHHSHPKTGAPSPIKTQTPVEVQQLENLIQKLPLTLSKRVFVTGGGHAPGKDGAEITDLNNGKVGKVSNIPGGYFVSKPGSFKGKINS